MKDLTARQEECLVLIAGYIDVHGYPPTMREIAEGLGCNISTAHAHVHALIKKGDLEVVGGGRKLLRVVGE